MTFDAARSKQLAKLDAALDRMRKLVAEPNWCNPEHRELREAKEDVDGAIRSIARINEVAFEAD